MIDLSRYNEELKRSGLPEAQANTILKVMSSFMNDGFSTKADFEKLSLTSKYEFEKLSQEMKFMEDSIRKDMNSMETGIRKDMAAMGDKITIRLSGVMAVLLSAMYTLLKV